MAWAVGNNFTAIYKRIYRSAEIRKQIFSAAQIEGADIEFYPDPEAEEDDNAA